MLRNKCSIDFGYLIDPAHYDYVHQPWVFARCPSHLFALTLSFASYLGRSPRQIISISLKRAVKTIYASPHATCLQSIEIHTRTLYCSKWCAGCASIFAAVTVMSTSFRMSERCDYFGTILVTTLQVTPGSGPIFVNASLRSTIVHSSSMVTATLMHGGAQLALP